MLKSGLRYYAPLACGQVAHPPKPRHIASVAKPIEPTPILKGEDAEQLLRELKDVCSPEEAARRAKKSDELLAQVLRPAGWRKATFGDA